MDTTIKQSQTINLLRFPLILLVLFVHSHAIDYLDCISPDQFAEGSIGQILFTFFALFFDTLGMATVPAFFFISGFLFFYNIDTLTIDLYRTKLLKRVRTLLVPFILWNLLSWLNTVSIPFIGWEGTPNPWHNPDSLPLIGFLWNSTTMCVGMHNWWGLDIQLYYPEDISLWYIRDLIAMCILSPIVYFFVKRAKWIGIIPLALLFFFGLPNINGLGSQALLFFVLGATFSIHHINLYEWSLKYGLTLTITTLLFLLITISGRGGILYQCGLPLVCISSIGAYFYLASTCVRRWDTKIIPLLAQSGFFIYAIHLVPFGNTNILGISGNWSRFWVNTILPEGPVASAAIVLSTIITTAGLSITIYALLRRTAPSLLKLFTGGR